MGLRFPVPVPAPAPAGPMELASVSLVAVGDIMMHLDVKTAGEAAPDGLQGLWAEVVPLFRHADLVFGNLETPVAPTTGQPGVPFQFNAPAELPAALKASGFTVLATANNHAFDQGAKGVRETLERLEAERLLTVGTGRTRAEAEGVRVLEVRGLRVAFLGFTDLFNANLNRKALDPWVAGLDLRAAEKAVAQARAQADLVIVSLHWGAEYSHEPLPRQRRIATRLAESGASLILGHHPHVLQPVAWAGQGDRQALVAYSMGNFIANQDRMYDPNQAEVPEGDSRDGVALQCRLVKRRLADGTVRVGVEEVHCEPLWIDNNWRQHRAGEAPLRVIRVLPVNQAIRAAQGELDQALEPGEQERLGSRLRLLRLRKARAASILGEGWVTGEQLPGAQAALPKANLEP